MASEASISRSTLILLERGESVSLSTLIQGLRVLDQLQVMAAFVVEQLISPLALDKMQKEKRQRAIDEINAAVAQWKKYTDEVAVSPGLRDQIAKTLLRLK
jgi:hypothetical protein